MRGFGGVFLQAHAAQGVNPTRKSHIFIRVPKI